MTEPTLKEAAAEWAVASYDYESAAMSGDREALKAASRRLDAAHNAYSRALAKSVGQS